MSLIIVSMQVTTSIEQQATESSLCERNTTAGLSTQGREAAHTAVACRVHCLLAVTLTVTFSPCFQLRWTARRWWCLRWPIRTRRAPLRTCALWRCRAQTPLPMAPPTPRPSMEAAPAWSSSRAIAAWPPPTLGPATRGTASPRTPRSLWSALRTGPRRTTATWSRRIPRTTRTRARNSGLPCTYATSWRRPNFCPRSLRKPWRTPSSKRGWWAASSRCPSLSPRRRSLARPPPWPPPVEPQPSALWRCLPRPPLPAGLEAPGFASASGRPPPRHNPPLPQPRAAAYPRRGRGGSGQPRSTASWLASSVPPVTPSPAPLRQEVSWAQVLTSIPQLDCSSDQSLGL